MDEIKILSRKDLKNLSSEEIKKHYKEYQDYLKTQLTINLRDKAEFEVIDKNNKRKKINHALYIVAAELLSNPEFAIPFLKDLSSKTRFTERHTNDLNLLMESKGLDKVIKFTPCQIPEKKKTKDNSKSKDDATSAEQKDEKAPEEPKSVETPTESKA